MVFVRQGALAVDVAIDDEIVVDGLRQRAVHDLLVAVLVHQRPALEEFRGDGFGTVGDGLRQLRLQTAREAVITLVGDDRQHIHGMDVVAQHVLVHALAVLVHAEAQSAPHLLALADAAPALLQGADLEDVRVVPPLAQGRMGEDEAHRGTLGIKIKQQFLVPHDEVVGIAIVRGPLLLVRDHAVDGVPLLVDGEIAAVGLMRGDGVEITLIRPFAQLLLHLIEGGPIFLLENLGVGPRHLIAACVVLLVLRHLVDEEEAQHLDAFWEELPFPLDVGEDGLVDLDPAELVVIALPGDFPDMEFEAIQERDGIVPPVNPIAQDDEIGLVLIEFAGEVVEVLPALDRYRPFPDARRALDDAGVAVAGLRYADVERERVFVR